LRHPERSPAFIKNAQAERRISRSAGLSRKPKLHPAFFWKNSPPPISAVRKPTQGLVFLTMACLSSIQFSGVLRDCVAHLCLHSSASTVVRTPAGLRPHHPPAGENSSFVARLEFASIPYHYAHPSCEAKRQQSPLPGGWHPRGLSRSFEILRSILPRSRLSGFPSFAASGACFARTLARC